MPPRRKPAVVVKVPVRAPYKKKARQEQEESSESRTTSPDEASDVEDVPAPSKTTTSKKPSQSASASQSAAVINMDEEVAYVPAIAAPSRKRTKKKALLLTEEQEVNMGEWLRSHPELFTKSLKAYKDSAKKSKLWDDKADEMDVESSALLRTWYESIRTKIGKLTSTTSGSATKESTERDIFIMSNFAFLKEHISRVRGRNAMSVSMKMEKQNCNCTLPCYLLHTMI